MPGRRRPSLQLLAQLLIRLAHVRVPHVHLAVEVVRQPAVVVEPGEVRAADVADLQLLVARGPRGVGEGLEFALARLLLVLGGADLVELVEGEGDGAGFAQDGDLEEAGVDGFGEVGDLFQLFCRQFSPLFLKSKHQFASEEGVLSTYQVIRLPNLIRRLLQPSLRGVDPTITLVNVLLHVAHVVIFEPPFRLLARRGSLVLRLQALAVHLGTRAQVLLGVGELVVRTRADEVRATDFRVGDGELGVAGGGTSAHKLVRCEEVSFSVLDSLAEREGERGKTYLP